MKNRESVKDELSSAHTQRASTAMHTDQYLAWCAANNVPALPSGDNLTGDRVLRAYLHAMHESRTWSQGTVSEASSAVAQYYLSNQHPDPRGPLTTAWRKAHARNNPPDPKNKADALTMTEVKTAVESFLAPNNEHTPLQALVAVASAASDCGMSCNPFMAGTHRQLTTLNASDFTVTNHAITTNIGDICVIIDKERTPCHYDAVRSALGSGSSNPLASPRSIRRNVERLKATWESVILHEHPDLTPEDWWTGSSSGQREKLARNLDTERTRNIRDSALLLTAVLNLLRPTEVARLTIGHMKQRRDDSGYDFTLLEHKGTELAKHHGRKAPVKYGTVEHRLQQDGTCTHPCPACILDDHIELRTDLGAGPEDPLFVSVNGCTRGQVLGVGGIKHILRRAAQTPHTCDGQERHITARSARVTGATALRKSGATYSELLDAGLWEDAHTARLYVRTDDSETRHLTHRLD